MPASAKSDISPLCSYIGLYFVTFYIPNHCLLFIYQESGEMHVYFSAADENVIRMVIDFKLVNLQILTFGFDYLIFK